MDDQKQPEYGQTNQPQYGAMSGQYPGYDPYLYGKPEPEQPKSGDAAAQGNQGNAQPMGAQPYAGQGQQGQPYNPYGQQNPYGQPGQQNPYGQQPNSYGQPNQYNPYAQPNQYNPYAQAPQQGQQPNGMPMLQYFNPDDPQQNPFYGHWDSYAIVAFVCSILFSMPVLPAVIGILSLARTKRLHMRGRGLAIAAIIINVLTTLLQAYLLIKGININDLYSQMLNMYSGGGTGGGSGDGSISA